MRQTVLFRCSHIGGHVAPNMGSVEGGFGQRVASIAGFTGMKILNYGMAKRFEDHFNWRDLELRNRLTPE